MLYFKSDCMPFWLLLSAVEASGVSLALIASTQSESVLLLSAIFFFSPLSFGMLLKSWKADKNSYSSMAQCAGDVSAAKPVAALNANTVAITARRNDLVVRGCCKNVLMSMLRRHTI